MLSMLSAYQEPSRCVLEGVEYCNGEIVRGMSDWGLLQVSLRRVKCIYPFRIFTDLPEWKPKTAPFTSICIQKCNENVSPLITFLNALVQKVYFLHLKYIKSKYYGTICTLGKIWSPYIAL